MSTKKDRIFGKENEERDSLISRNIFLSEFRRALVEILNLH